MYNINSISWFEFAKVSYSASCPSSSEGLGIECCIVQERTMGPFGTTDVSKIIVYKIRLLSRSISKFERLNINVSK